jgi:glycosyltransferase involved in cell wall biosynthesis
MNRKLRSIKELFLSLGSSKKEKLVKISVMIPTYNTDPEALDRLIKSIDAQTMSMDEYEIIFIDDGSTTNIYEVLKELATERSNIIVQQIPNSGWGSRPRNVGTKLASGHYILYLDHDDTVFPETFERVYEYGIANNADVVNAKEVRTKGWSWGWDQFKENNPSAEKLGIQSLLPMTPHKFYRREFLLENDITFNEGARVLWEDVYFNTKVFSCGAKVAILADYPSYYWIDTGANNSSSFGRDPHEKWEQIRKLITFFTETISNKEDLDFMLKHWYQSRVLGILGAWLLDKSEDRIQIEFDYAKKVAEDLIPLYIDDELNKINQLRSYLLRNNNLEALKEIAKNDKGITARPFAKNVQWQDGLLTLDVETEMSVDEKHPYLLEYEEDRIFRAIPSDLKQIIPDRYLDLTEEMKDNSFKASIKDRNTRVTWETPVSSSCVEIRHLPESKITFKGNMQFSINMENAAMGSPLRKNPWDIAARFSALGMTFHRGIVGSEGYIEAALVNGRTAVSYTNKSQLLSLDVGSKVHSIISVANPQNEDMKIEKEKDQTTITIELPNVQVFGETKIKGSIILKEMGDGDNNQERKVKAFLIGDGKQAKVVATFDIPVGEYSITTVFEGRKSKLASLILSIS